MPLISSMDGSRGRSKVQDRELRHGACGKGSGGSPAFVSTAINRIVASTGTSRPGQRGQGGLRRKEAAAAQLMEGCLEFGSVAAERLSCTFLHEFPSWMVCQGRKRRSMRLLLTHRPASHVQHLHARGSQPSSFILCQTCNMPGRCTAGNPNS